MVFPEVALQDLFATPIRNGIYKKKEFHGSGVPILNMGELFAADRILCAPDSLIDVTDEELDRFGVEPGDLLFGRRSLVFEGSGKCSIVDLAAGERCVFESSLIRVRVDQRKADPDFLLAFFLSSQGRDRVLSIATQTAVAGIRGSDLALLPVPAPPVATQRQLGRVLRALDKLIENNRRRIEILEEIARLIYREWFVHFRFPGHEDVELADSVLGLIPAGWNVGVIGDLGDVVTGSTPPTNEASLYGGIAPFLTPSDMTGERFAETARSLSEQGIKRFERRMVPPGSVCFTCIGSIGKLAVAADLLLTNQQINSVVPSPPYSSGFVYQLLQDRSDYVLSIASGAATPIVNKSTFIAIEVLLPHPDVLASFDRVECPMGELVRTLTHQNRILGEARALLLARLISGELDVSDLGLDLEPVV